MKPFNPYLPHWALRVFLLALLPVLLSFDNTQTHQLVATTESEFDQPTEGDMVFTPTPPKGRNPKKISIAERKERNSTNICITVKADWTSVDYVVVEVKKFRKGAWLSNRNRSYKFKTTTSLLKKISFSDEDKYDLELTAWFYKDDSPTEGTWCDQDGSTCIVPPEDRCTDSNVPVATVKSTAASGNSSVTVSVDEQ